MENVILKKMLRNMLLCLSSGGMLAACGGSTSEAPNTNVKSQLLAASTVCYATWNAATAYNGGDKVSYSGLNYTANWPMRPPR